MTYGEIEMVKKLLINKIIVAMNNSAIKHLGWLPLLVPTLILLPSCAHMDSTIAARTQAVSKDYGVLVKHYEDLAKEANSRLQINREALAEYEAHSYYYGRGGQDLRSHASANIREYEKALKENLSNANLNKRMAMEQNRRINKANINLYPNSAEVR